MMPLITIEDFEEKLREELQTEFNVTPIDASDKQLYKALSAVVVELLRAKRRKFRNKVHSSGRKEVYYLSMEFLMGRSLKTSLFNLGINEMVDDIFKKWDINLDRIYEYGDYEPNANGPGIFTADNAGFALSETIIYGTMSSPQGVNGKSIKRRTITDRYGNPVQTEIYALVNGSFVLAQWQIYEFNIRHKVIRSLSSKSQLQEMNWVYDAPCQKITDVGTEYVYEYNSRDLLSKETKKGIAGQADIVTTYSYNADGKVISTVISGGNLTLSTAKSYDMAGRLVQETDASGLITPHPIIDCIVSPAPAQIGIPGFNPVSFANVSDNVPMISHGF